MAADHDFHPRISGGQLPSEFAPAIRSFSRLADRANVKRNHLSRDSVEAAPGTANSPARRLVPTHDLDRIYILTALACGLIGAVCDVRSRRIPNWLTGTAIGLGLGNARMVAGSDGTRPPRPWPVPSEEECFCCSTWPVAWVRET